MATTIITKHSATAKDPQPNQLERGELAIDLARKNIYTKDFSDEVVQLGGSSVKIGSAAPPTPQEGDLWMEVPTTVDEPAMMWVYDGDKWLEHPSGVDGAPGADGADGNIADATEQGVVATWDDSAKQWTPDSSLAIDSSGNVGIGTGAPAAQFEVKGSNTNARFRGVGSQMINVNFSETPSSAEIDFRNAGNFHISKQGSPALTIDSTGDATFSGAVSAGDVHIGNDYQAGSMGFSNANWGMLFRAPNSPSDFNYGFQDVDGDNLFTIDATGNATFSGTVSGKNVNSEFLKLRGRTVSSDHFGIQMGSSLSILPTDNTGTVTGSAESDIGSRAYPFRDVWLAGSVYPNGGTAPLASTRDLIETLATLRNATKDETVDVRQALASACDKLIEKFEAMQSTATQEIES